MRVGWIPTVVHGHAEVPLSRGAVCTVDLADLPSIRGFAWSALSTPDGHLYAYCSSAKLLMHRLLLGLSDFRIKCDHANLDTLDNRRLNLRVATNTENSFNRNASKNSKTGVKGVSFDAHRGKFVSHISVNGRQRMLGRFDLIDDAKAAYVAESKRLHGVFARNDK